MLEEIVGEFIDGRRVEKEVDKTRGGKATIAGGRKSVGGGVEKKKSKKKGSGGR